MNQIKLLKLKIKSCNSSLDQKRVAYYHRKELINQDNKFTTHFLYMGAVSFIFILVSGRKFRRQVFNLAKNIIKAGLKKF